MDYGLTVSDYFDVIGFLNITTIGIVFLSIAVHAKWSGFGGRNSIRIVLGSMLMLCGTFFWNGLIAAFFFLAMADTKHDFAFHPSVIPKWVHYSLFLAMMCGGMLLGLQVVDEITSAFQKHRKARKPAGE